jgi:hypothetical protein
MNTIPSFQDVSFDDEATHAMGTAFDLTCKLVGNFGVAVTVREIVAMRIIEAAKAGEREPSRLCEEALKELGIDTASMQLAA